MLLEARDSAGIQHGQGCHNREAAEEDCNAEKHKKALQKECAELKGMVPWHTSQCRSLDTSLMQETLQHNAFQWNWFHV